MIRRVRWIEGGVLCERVYDYGYVLRRAVLSPDTGRFLSADGLSAHGTREEMILIANAIRVGGEYVGGAHCAVRMIRFGALLWGWDSDECAGIWYQDALSLADQIFRKFAPAKIASGMEGACGVE